MIRPTRETPYKDSNKENEIAIAGAGGIEVVLGAMKTHSGHPGVQGEGCWALGFLAGNADKMATQLSYHFSSLNWCNPMGWMGGSVCAEAVETSGTIGQGPPGTTQLITKSGSPSILFIDTKYTCEPLPLTEGCNQGKSLTDSVKLN